MINTLTTKRQQLTNGYFQVGSGPEVIFIIGSCRVIPYVIFLNDWNIKHNKFTIIFIDPFNFHYDLDDNRISLEDKIISLENDSNLLNMIKSSKYFIHEFLTNFGMFNCSKQSEKNIYQFGMNPEIDILIPSFNNVFILTRDIVCFHMDIRKKAIADYNVIGRLSEQTLNDIELIKKAHLDKFYDLCSKTDFPEFSEIFSDQYKAKRFFWTFNHVSNNFTHSIFQSLNSKFLHLNIDSLSEEDLFANNYTYLSEYDTQFQWEEEIKPLRDSL